MSLLSPLLRAVAQLDDRVFTGVVWRSIAWSLAAFVALAAAVDWGMGQAVQSLVAGHATGFWVSFWGRIAGLLGGAGVAVLSLWLFLPVVTVIASLFCGRVAQAVERRFYPGLPPARAASLFDQARDGVALGVRVLGFQILALLLALLVPGLGLLLGWAIAAWAVGRGLFVAVAMLRMNRAQAMALYLQCRSAVLVQGALMTAGSLIPLANLLVPVLGAAAMVHVMRSATERPNAT